MGQIPSATPISDAVKASVKDAFKSIPEGKRGALLVIADESGARATVAARVGEHWKVAAGAAKPWDGPVSGTVAVIGSW